MYGTIFVNRTYGRFPGSLRRLSLPGQQFAGVKLGKSPLSLANMVWLGITSAIHGASFACVLTFTLKLLEDQQQSAAKLKKAQNRANGGRNADAASTIRGGRSPTTVSEAAFAKAHQRMPVTFWIELTLSWAKGSNNSTATCTISAAFACSPWTARESIAGMPKVVQTLRHGQKHA